MNENSNMLLPRVGHFGKDKGGIGKSDEDSGKPKRKGQISKSTRFKKHKTLNRFDAASDHTVKQNISMKKESLSIGLPHVAARGTTTQSQEADQLDKPNQVSFPQILVKHSNKWGKREQVKRDDMDLKVEGSDLPLPPPKPLTIPRTKHVHEDDVMEGGSNDEEDIGEVADIRKILHCHIVGIPVEIRKVKDNELQVARPIFHCQKCLDYYLETCSIKEDCTEEENHVRGPKIQISEDTAQLIRSVWGQKKDEDQEKTKKKKHEYKPPKSPRTHSKHKTKTKSHKKTEHGHRGKNVQKEEVDPDLQDMVHPDDYSVVLEHIAEGIARNAGFNESVLNSASQGVAENLNSILAGKKPEDPAMMELIEKHLGETELMILRAMVDSEKGGPTIDTDQHDNVAGSIAGEKRISSQVESANRLLDRLAVLKSRDFKDVQADKVVYLTEVFKGKDLKGKISDTYMNHDKSNEHDTDSEFFDTTIDEYLERDDGYVMTEGIMKQPKRAVGGKYTHQKKAKAGHLERKQELNMEHPIDHVELAGIKIPGQSVVDDEESYMDDYSSFHSYSSMGSTDEVNTTDGASRTPRSDETDKSADTRSTVHRKRHKNKIGPFADRRSGKSLHKVYKKGKQSQYTKPLKKQHKEFTEDGAMSVTVGYDKYKKLVDARESQHIFYDADDMDDYDSSDEEGGFLIPGNDGYTDSAYDNLVDELVLQFETKATVDDNKEKIDTSKFKRAIQRRAVKKATLKKDMHNDAEDEQEAPRFRPGSTVNAGAKRLDERQRLEREGRYTEDDISNEQTRDLDNGNNHLKLDFKEKYRRKSEGHGYENYSRENASQRGSLIDQEINQHKRLSIGEDQNSKINNAYKTSQDGMSIQDMNLSLINFNGTNQQRRKSSLGGSNSRGGSRFIQQQSPGVSGENLSLNMTDQEIVGQTNTRRGSIMSGSTVPKHVAVGETHFGMQLDALANLPAVPNPLEMTTRRRSVALPNRQKVLPKAAAVQAHHSRQIENKAFDATKAQRSEIRQPDERVKPQPSEYDRKKSVMSTTQIEKSKSKVKKPSHSISLVKKEGGPIRTLIGHDQQVFATQGSRSSSAGPSSRPSSSKQPLPSINHMQNAEQYHADNANGIEHSGRASKQRLNDKPVATVKPMVKDSQGRLVKATSHGSLQSTGSRTEDYDERPSSHIILPPSNSISILSFTPSFSFSLFSLPNQYRQRNETVKSYVSQVGKTQAKETSQTILNKIPTKNKTKGVKNAVVLKNKQVVTNLNKKVQQKVNDPKPIARYVKKILPTLKEEDVHTVPKQHSQQQSENAGKTTDSSHSQLNSSSINIDVVDESGQYIFDIESQHSENDNIDEGNINASLRNAVYASLPMESQMHLQQHTESIIIRVQNYS